MLQLLGTPSPRPPDLAPKLHLLDPPLYHSTPGITLIQNVCHMRRVEGKGPEFIGNKLTR